MRIERSFKLINLSVWCLLSLWLAFGACELAEASELLDESLTEDATHQDLEAVRDNKESQLYLNLAEIMNPSVIG